MSYMDRDPHEMYSNDNSDGPGPRLMGAGTLMGEGVLNTEGEELGDIKEIMLDMQTGQVAYAVLSFGGIFGIADKLFAVPWQALTLDTVQKRFILDVPKKQLQNAPGFAKDRWPDMANQQFSDEIHGFYNAPPRLTETIVSSSSMAGHAAASKQNANGGNTSIQSSSGSATSSGLSRQGDVSGTAGKVARLLTGKT